MRGNGYGESGMEEGVDDSWSFAFRYDLRMMVDG